jgi:hypothetical protein
MNRIKVILVGISLLSAATDAVAQSAPANLPYHTVFGRIGAKPGDTGPGSAIPFAFLFANQPLPAGDIWVGSAAGLQSAVALSGDCTISLAGVIICTKTNGVSFGTMANQGASSVAITGGTITGLPTPTNPSDAAPKSYVDAHATTQQCTLANSAGFVGDGTTANDTAFNTWWSGLSSTGGCLEFGVGKYAFSAAISKSMANGRQSIQIRGLNDASILFWPAGGGLEITAANTLNSVHIHDLTITTGAVNTGSGLFLNSPGLTGGFTGAQSEIYNVQIRGDDYTDQTGNTDYWAVSLNIGGWSNLYVNNVNTYGLIGAPGAAGGGIGILYGGVGTFISGVATFNACNMYFHSVAFELGDFWEGVTISNSNAQGETGSVGLFAPSGTHNGPFLTLINNQFNTAGTQIDILTSLSQLIMMGNTVTAFGANTGAALGTGPNVTVVGNTFNCVTCAGTTGVQLDGQNGIAEGNTFVSVATGVFLASASTNVNVSQNTYQGVTTQVTNSGTGNSVGVATK